MEGQLCFSFLVEGNVPTFNTLYKAAIAKQESL